MRPAARILLAEADALPAVLEGRAGSDYARPTVCTGWSVRDVLAHCGAALTAAASGTTHTFTPEDNERDVETRRTWPIDDVLAELYEGYAAAAAAIDEAGGVLDGIGLGEWIHGGDVRDALDAPDPYTSAGVDLAVPLLVERSAARQARRIDVRIGSEIYGFGVGDAAGSVHTDVETFVRLCSGRRPDPSRYRLDGIDAADLVLFT